MRPAIDGWGVARAAVTVVVVAGAAALVLAQFQPQLLVSDTTPAGGDMGAHVWSPAYMRDHLLPKGRLSGWTPDWYAGFPAMQFYMVIPMLAIVVLSTVVPYGVAFKAVSVAGVVSLPISAYAFARLTRLRFPLPALMSLAAAAFVFDRGFSIYGGNAASTLAGEFAFAISLSLAVLTLGFVGRGIAEGTHRATSAVLVALTGLCHLIPAFFVLTGVVLWFVLWLARDTYEAVGSLAPERWSQWWAATRARLLWLVPVGVVGGLLAAFWVLPFYGKSRYLNDMGWQKDERFTDFLFWRDQLGGGGLADHPTLAGVLALALLGAVVSIALRNRSGLLFSGLAVAAAVGFWFLPQGRLWNTRLLPFYYLSLLFLAAIGLGRLPEALRRRRPRRVIGLLAGGLTLGLQLALATEPRSAPGFDSLTWGDRWHPFVVVGALATLAAGAAEVIDTPPDRRRRVAWVLVGLAAAAQVAMVREPASRSPEALLTWALGLLALVGLAVALDLIGRSRGEGRHVDRLAPALGLVATLCVVVTGFVYLALPLRSLGALATERADGTYALRGLDRVRTGDDSFVDSWAAWNYRGYEAGCRPESSPPCDGGRKPYWPEYHAVVTTMEEVADTHGCGRAMWEYNSELDRYGTPMALMLLPHWTDGCIGSMEGLYFEASTTTPYHFINQDQLSEAGSNAQRGMPYGPGAPTRDDFDLGVRHLQMLGVRYYLAYTPSMTGFAREHPALTEVATAPSMCLPTGCPDGVTDPPVRWVVFEVADSPLVEALANEPVVLEGIGDGHTCESVPVEEDPRGRQCRGWLDPSVDWYTDPSLWEVPFTEDGPEDWARMEVTEWLVTHDPGAPRSLPEVQVDAIRADDDEISFTVDEVGVPILVKASYFPNWRAEGADGPWRISPNLMVVVPTEREVRLSYGWVAIDLVAWGLTVLGLVGLVVLWRAGPVPIPAGPTAAWRTRPGGGHPGARGTGVDDNGVADAGVADAGGPAPGPDAEDAGGSAPGPDAEVASDDLPAGPDPDPGAPR